MYNYVYCSICGHIALDDPCPECYTGKPVTWDDVPDWYKQMCINSKPEDEWVVILPTGERLEDMD